MAFYDSEKQAAYFALTELKSYLPAAADRSVKEWGTAIYRMTDSEGGYVYSYNTPYIGLEAEWERRIQPPDGAKEVAYCHSHPNDAPFSVKDRTTALGRGTLANMKSNFYMVTQSGAYCYDGKIEVRVLEENSLRRVTTLWGLPYPNLYYSFYPKI